MATKYFISFPATWHVLCPGKSAYMCNAHKLNTEKIAVVMGFNLASTHSFGKEYSNCINEFTFNLKTKDKLWLPKKK